MGLAESQFSTFYLGKSTVEATEPATYETIIPTGHSLEANAGSFQSEDIDPSGLAADSFRTNVSGRGDLSAHWRPGCFDKALETGLLSAFAAADTDTLTVSFSAVSNGIQTITDDGATGALAAYPVGCGIVVGGAVADPLNAGLRTVLVAGANVISVYNPTGVVSAADAGVSISHQGFISLGVTKSWQWAERVFSDGVNLIYSEFYKRCLVGNLSWSFPAAGPSRITIGLQGEAPTVVKANGSPPITKQRTGTDNPAVTDRLVHGMDDVRSVILYKPSVGIVELHDLMSLFEFQVQRNIRQDPAVGTANIVNTSPGRPSVGGRANAFINSVIRGTPQMVEWLLSNPDDVSLHAVIGANDTDAYTFYLPTLRFQAAGTPVGGNDQAMYINGQFSGTNIRITRF